MKNLILCIFLFLTTCLEHNSYLTQRYKNGLIVVSKNGLRASHYKMTKDNGDECGCQNLKPNEGLELLIDSLHGFIVKDKLVYLGAKILVKNELGEIILSSPDLINNEGLSLKDAKSILLYLEPRAISQLASGKYLLECKVWDKSNEEKNLLFKYNFRVSTVQRSVQD